MARLSRLILLCLLVFVSTSPANAQSGDSRNDFSLFVGYMLPNQIDHVTEVMPVFGGRYAFGLPLGAIEIDGANTHAAGVDWTSIGVSLRGEVPLGEGLSALIYGGPDLHWYRPDNSEDRRTDYGLHIGAAGLLLIKDSLWLRADLKFMGNPGTSLYLLGGLMFRNF